MKFLLLFIFNIFFMKIGIILTLILSLSLVSSVSAMTVTDDKMMAKKSTSAIATSMGYSWTKDRATLASKAGIVGYRGTVKQNNAIRTYLLSMKKDGAMMKKEDAMMKKDDKMMKGDTMTKVEAGMYKAYSASSVVSDLEAGKNVYLFFHASWCPSCRALDSAITSGAATIPAGSAIYKVDYDTETALRQKHSVTVQHTVVKLNSDGSMMKKISGPQSIADIIK
jgi:thioredoxin 1